MKFRIAILTILPIIAVSCYDSGSPEVNKIETTPPLYETIIFGDVAEILNEFENGINPMEALYNSASDSEENLEDLLFEYQHYLDKAHNQRMNYLEKAKTKNKVPLTRHDRYSKTKASGGTTKYNDYVYSGNYLNPKFSVSQYGGPLDMFMPMSDKFNYMGNNIGPVLPKEAVNFEKGMFELTPLFPKSSMDPMSSCICKSMQLPCDCKCKQCLIYDSTSKTYYHEPKYLPGEFDKELFPRAEYISEDKLGEDNTLNVRIKVDIQLPKIKDSSYINFLKNRSREDFNSKETIVNVPFPYFNFPIPMELFGYKNSKYSIHDPTHKILAHKKKKTRTNNGNKKHRKKVFFHNLNIKPQSHKIQPYYEDNITTTTITTKTTEFNETLTESSSQIITSTLAPTSELIEPVLVNNITAMFNSNTKDNITLNNETRTDESIYVTVNISNSSDNATEDTHKTENSVETDFVRIDKNLSTDKILMSRKKRGAVITNPVPELASKVTISVTKVNTPVTSKVTITLDPSETTTLDTKDITEQQNKLEVVPLVKNLPSQVKSVNENKKVDKIALADSELEYWPISKNLTDNTYKNITTIILERENTKAKLNISKETIHNNRTTVLEKAIFGDVNWDDVDTVAPVFLSFVGKYMRGVLTFCSQNVCHSMKCAEKSCAHRICHASDRWNQRGHCSGSKKTDSIASLESIMDLPSNVAFEIVDILQDKMLGKLFGKGTLCINSKCITFLAIKKSFMKSKCSVKDLHLGHCPNLKSSKTII